MKSLNELSILTFPLIDNKWNDKETNVYITPVSLEHRKGDTIKVKHPTPNGYKIDDCIIEDIRHLKYDEIAPWFWETSLWVGRDAKSMTKPLKTTLKQRFKNTYEDDAKLELVFLKPL